MVLDLIGLQNRSKVVGKVSVGDGTFSIRQGFM